MTKTVVLGVDGDTALYMVDLEARTVNPIEGTRQAELIEANARRATGNPVINGVSFAVAVTQAPAASAGHFEGR